MFCWFFRMMISSAADSNKVLSERAQKHIQHCPACRRFRQMCLSLETGLKHEAAALDNKLPGPLRRRILTAATVRGANAPGITISLRPAIAAACVAVAVLLGALLLRPPENEPPTVNPPQFGGLHNLVDAELPTVWAGYLQRPLTDEIENIADDTESAVRFLVACVAVDPTSAQRKLPN